MHQSSLLHFGRTPWKLLHFFGRSVFSIHRKEDGCLCKQPGSGTDLPKCALPCKPLQDKVLAQFSRFAAEATTPLRSLIAIPPSDVLQKQTQLTAAELRTQAEQLRTQALQASAKLTASILSDEERSALLKKGNEALLSAGEILKAQSNAASANISTILAEAERKKGIILEAVKGAPEPVREIAETAVAAHSQEKAKKGAIIHDFCLGITYGQLPAHPVYSPAHPPANP